MSVRKRSDRRGVRLGGRTDRRFVNQPWLRVTDTEITRGNRTQGSHSNTKMVQFNGLQKRLLPLGLLETFLTG